MIEKSLIILALIAAFQRVAPAPDGDPAPHVGGENILINPKTLKWAKGEEAKEKKILVAVAGDNPIFIRGVQCRNSEFRCALDVIEEGRIYEVRVVPKRTDLPGFAVISLRKAREDGSRSFAAQAFAVIPKAEAVPQKETDHNQGARTNGRILGWKAGIIGGLLFLIGGVCGIILRSPKKN